MRSRCRLLGLRLAGKEHILAARSTPTQMPHDETIRSYETAEKRRRRMEQSRHDKSKALEAAKFDVQGISQRKEENAQEFDKRIQFKEDDVRQKKDLVTEEDDALKSLGADYKEKLCKLQAEYRGKRKKQKADLREARKWLEKAQKDLEMLKSEKAKTL